ncbi:uncharacterized protein [Antedon mediterranea]|uniref:uncharacterized protein n=1 Tax=Antedon mediterranea TaxID=105859 RepID=UPI003AF461A2
MTDPNGKFNELKFNLSKYYEGQKHKWLRFILFDHIQRSMNKDASSKELFNILHDYGYITTVDVTLLHEIAQLTHLKIAEDLVLQYVKDTNIQHYGTKLSLYRKHLFNALREVDQSTLNGVVAHYQAATYRLETIWDVVFFLENNNILADEPDKITKFASLLGKRGQAILLSYLQNYQYEPGYQQSLPRGYSAMSHNPQLAYSYQIPNYQQSGSINQPKPGLYTNPRYYSHQQTYVQNASQFYHSMPHDPSVRYQGLQSEPGMLYERQTHQLQQPTAISPNPVQRHVLHQFPSTTPHRTSHSPVGNIQQSAKISPQKGISVTTTSDEKFKEVKSNFLDGSGNPSTNQPVVHEDVTDDLSKDSLGNNKNNTIQGNANTAVQFESAHLSDKESIDRLKSNQNVKTIPSETLPVHPSDDNTLSSEGTYGHVTISKKSEDKSVDFSIKSSSSKVFSTGLGHRDSSDYYSDNYSTSAAAFTSITSEATTSLTGKPVIQASDKESSVTDVMNHEFKPLTTGDFMLTLKCRQFQEIPEEILKDQRCKHTTKVNISSNRLKEIPRYLDIEHFPSMKILDGSKNKLVDLPTTITEFRGMENLDISHNQFRIFPEVVGCLKQLKILKVNNNSIEYIPNGLGFYKDLEILRLEGNKLSKIPEDIRQLETLQYLNISDNRLDEFPLVICNLKKLQFFYMSSNKIKEVPYYLYMNECLEVVQVDKNPIVKPPPDVLARPIQEIRRYCKEIAAGRFKDDRIVIIVQGTFNSGKSSVCSALCSDVTKRAVKPTEGVEERTAVIRDINVTIREFAGDLHYRGLTEVFIVPNALYVVTVDLKKYKSNVGSVGWFGSNVWQYLKKIVGNQTVFIVGTHADLIPSDSVEDLLSSLLKKSEAALRNEDKLLHLLTVFVDAKIDSFDQLKDDVTGCLLNRKLFPERGQYRPVKWKDAEPVLTTYKKVNQALNAQQKIALWIPIKTVHDLLNDFEGVDEIKTFLRFLRSVGSILWHERLHLLKNFICSNPALFIKAIKIIMMKDHKEALIKAYKPRWRLNPVPEDDVTYVIANQMYSSRGCINMESIRRILKAVLEDKEDITMVMVALTHFDVCKEVNICTPDIKILEIQEGLEAGVTIQEEKWPQIATEVLQPNSPFNDDDLPQDLLTAVARNLGKDWVALLLNLGFTKREIDTVSAQFAGNSHETILYILETWKKRSMDQNIDAKAQLMETLNKIGRSDLMQIIKQFDLYDVLAQQLHIVLPTFKKLKREKIYFFPAFLKNGEAQMSTFWQVIQKKFMNHQNYSFDLGTDHGQTFDEIFVKFYVILVETTLTHQIWKDGMLTEGIDDAKDKGVLYYFQFRCTGDNINLNASAACNEAIPSYCEKRLNLLVENMTEI